jgi:glycosyltransferase involved in cell wall biosynthesis
LALICSRSVFWERLNQKIQQKNLQKWVKLLGFVDDENVSKIYSLALALVHPSKMEGFGLTGLEAMSVGLPVISSNASCLPEVYGDAALYFSPNDSDDLVSCLDTLVKDQELRNQLSTKGFLQARKYSWAKMAKETLSVYKQTFS